jgi:hypothetical protein
VSVRCAPYPLSKLKTTIQWSLHPRILAQIDQKLAPTAYLLTMERSSGSKKQAARLQTLSPPRAFRRARAPRDIEGTQSWSDPLYGRADALALCLRREHPASESRDHPRISDAPARCPRRARAATRARGEHVQGAKENQRQTIAREGKEEHRARLDLPLPFCRDATRITCAKADPAKHSSALDGDLEAKLRA